MGKKSKVEHDRGGYNPIPVREDQPQDGPQPTDAPHEQTKDTPKGKHKTVEQGPSDKPSR